MPLAAVDLAVASCIVCAVLWLLLPLTFVCTLLTPRFKRLGLVAAAADSSPSPSSQTLVLLARPMLQLYGSVLLVGGVYALAGPAASALSVPLYHALSRDATLLALSKQPLSALDLSFLLGALPLLCVPALLIDGAGGGLFIYLFAGLYWRCEPHQCPNRVPTFRTQV